MSLRLRRPARSTTVSAPASDPRAGFSLIELLTVIAIIAILAAIIFPIAGVVRVRAQQTQVISNMRQIHSALNMYKLDEHGYPSTLGPLTFGAGSSTSRQDGGLYPEHMKDRKVYESPANDASQDIPLKADLGTAQSKGTIYTSGMPSTIAQTDPLFQGNGTFSALDTMDGSVINPKDDPSKWQYLIHYSRYRIFDKNDQDYKRQLGFRNPPEDTVVTWNDTFVDRTDQGLPLKGDYLVLFLNGDVKKFSVDTLKQRLMNYGWPQREELWRLTP